MILQFTKSEFDTVLGALRYYQRGGMGEPSNRPGWLQDIVCPTADATSLSGSDIDQFCERINTGDKEPELLAVLRKLAFEASAREEAACPCSLLDAKDRLARATREACETIAKVTKKVKAS